QDGDDGDYHQQFDQGEAPIASQQAGEIHNATPTVMEGTGEYPVVTNSTMLPIRPFVNLLKVPTTNDCLGPMFDPGLLRSHGSTGPTCKTCERSAPMDRCHYPRFFYQCDLGASTKNGTPARIHILGHRPSRTSGKSRSCSGGHGRSRAN